MIKKNSDFWINEIPQTTKLKLEEQKFIHVQFEENLDIVNISYGRSVLYEWNIDVLLE